MTLDFTKLRYRIDQVPETELVVDHFKELKQFKEFDVPERDQLLRILIFGTDEGSPFVKLELEDYDKRLSLIFEYMFIPDDSLAQKISSGTCSEFEDMFNRWIMLTNNLAYVMLVNKLRMFHYIGIALRQPVSLKNMVADMDKRAALDKKLEAIYEGIINYEVQVFPDLPTRLKVRKQGSKLIQPAEEYAVEKQVI